jgi:hypothetical protein
MSIGIGIGIPFIRVSRGAAIDAQAQAHFDRVIADGGLVPSGLSGVNAFFTTVKTIYATADITTAISVGLDAQVLGYKLGAGAGTTAGQAAQKLYSCSGASGDVVQTTAASQPLLLVHSGANYWFSVQDSGNFLNSTTTYATSDFDVEFSVNLQGTATTQRVVSGNTTGNPWSIIFNGTTNTIFIEYYVGGYKNNTCLTSLSGLNTFRISRNSTTGAITVLKNGVSQVISGVQFAGALDSLPTAVRIGNITTAQGFQGIINWVKLYIGGSVVREMNPNQYNAATSQTQWTSSTGEVWTINTGTAATGYKGVLVDRTIVQSDGIDDTINSGTLTIGNEFTAYEALAPQGVTGGLAGLYNLNAGTLMGAYYPSATAAAIRGSGGGGDLINVTNFIQNTRLLFMWQKENTTNGVGDLLFINNVNRRGSGSRASNNTANVLQIFVWGASLRGQYTMNSFIISKILDNTAQQTGVYNYIKSINNNAF